MAATNNKLVRAAWILIILGIFETLFLVYAIYSKSSFSGGAFIYILLGIFLLKRGRIAYKLSQFIFTMLFLFVPAGLTMFLLMFGQIHTAGNVPISLELFDSSGIILIIYIAIISYLVMLLHHPSTRYQLSLEAYDSDRRTLYIPKKRAIIIPICFLIFVGLIMGPNIVRNPYVSITAGLAGNVDIKNKVGNITSLELLASNTHNWNTVTVWKIHGDIGKGVYTAILDPKSSLKIKHYGQK